MKLILSRHGNTFDSTMPVTWVGSQNDLPLVEKGITQAKSFAHSFQQSGDALSAVYCGPLKRTRDYAEIILNELGSSLNAIVDPRLNEVDYGAWSGLTNNEIHEKFGDELLEKWEKKSEWPANIFGCSEESVRTDVSSFINDLMKKFRDDETVLVVTSNGKCRYFLDLIPGEFEKRKQENTFKVKTGNICRLDFYDGEWQLIYWDQPSV